MNSSSSWGLPVDPVSVYRVGTAGADPSYFFAGEVADSDLCRAVWLGWLPLTLLDFAGPGLALSGDVWLTGSSAASEGGHGATGAGVVTAQAAATELIARGRCGLTAFTSSPPALWQDGSLWTSSLGVLVADDLVAHIGRLRAVHAAFLASVDGVDGVEREWALLDACKRSPTGDSPEQRRFGRALLDLQAVQLRLCRFLEAVVRIRVFDPAVGR